jgi:serine/threonine protein phosphatase PrpC
MDAVMDPEKAIFTLKFETGAATHVGCVRKANEDSLIARPDIGLWAVADGVGGYEAGQLASQTVVADLDTLGPAVSQADQVARFGERILRANDHIRDLMLERGGSPMGSTVASVLIFDRGYACAWSGDSRVYRVRDGGIAQLSKDHSEVQELIDEGLITPEQARTWPRRNVITRAIGIFDDPGLEVAEGEVKAGDTFLICSDGLTGHMTDEEICSYVDQHRPQEACDRMIAETLERGANDNVSIIVIRCHRAERTNFFPGSAAASMPAGAA